MAMDCLKANMYNKSKCELEFENTRACKKFWVSNMQAESKMEIKLELLN